MKQIVLDIDGLIELRRDQVRKREYQPLGLLKWLMLEPDTPAAPTPALVEVSRKISVTMDWYRSGAPLGMTPDGDVVVCGPLPPLPEIPDPNWKPQTVEAAKQKPPMIPQSMEERASGWFQPKGNHCGPWLVFQPVAQIMFVVQGISAWGTVDCFADAEGRHTTLFYNPRTQEAHFLFGTKRLTIGPTRAPERYESPYVSPYGG